MPYLPNENDYDTTIRANCVDAAIAWNYIIAHLYIRLWNQMSTSRMDTMIELNVVELESSIL